MITRPGCIVLLTIILISSCNTNRNHRELLSEIKEIVNSQTGDFAIAFKNISTGEELLINEHEKFHAASTMKTPVMIEVYKQAHEGKFNLTDTILIKNEFKSIVDSSIYNLSIEDDSFEELYTQVNQYKRIDSLVYDMIIVSSNLATNIIIDLVGAKNVTQSMRELGAPDINVLRGVEDIKAFNKGLSNATTAYDLLLIYEKLATHQVVSTFASEAMIKTLLEQRFNSIIPAKLPINVKVAHKTGAITGVHHDSGIVFLPDGRKYVLVLLSKNLEDFEQGTAALADISEVIYKYVIEKSL